MEAGDGICYLYFVGAPGGLLIMIKSQCCSICGSRREPAYGHHHNSARSFSHMKNQPCHQHSEMIPQHGVIWQRATHTHTLAQIYTCTHVQYAYTCMNRHTEKPHRYTLPGTHYYNPDRWIDIPPPPSHMVTTSFLVTPFHLISSLWTVLPNSN